MTAGIWWLQGVPWGFKETLKYLWNRYKLPLYITENVSYALAERQMLILFRVFVPRVRTRKSFQRCSVSLINEGAFPYNVSEDDGRVEYFKSYLNSMLEAIEEGVDVRSYYA